MNYGFMCIRIVYTVYTFLKAGHFLVRWGQRDTWLESGTAPPKAGRMVTLDIIRLYTIIERARILMLQNGYKIALKVLTFAM